MNFLTLTVRRVVTVMVTRGGDFRPTRLFPGLKYIARNDEDNIFCVRGMGWFTIREQDAVALDLKPFAETFIEAWHNATTVGAVIRELEFTCWAPKRVRRYADLLLENGVPLPPLDDEDTHPVDDN
jgi:hypothetical protein